MKAALTSLDKTARNVTLDIPDYTESERERGGKVYPRTGHDGPEGGVDV
jgi:hypothetical protein